MPCKVDEIDSRYDSNPLKTMNTRNYQEQIFTEKILNEHLKTKPKWLATCGKVNRYTRAGKGGKFIICPICEQGGMVYHFSWSALQCQHCGSLVTKRHWKVTG